MASPETPILHPDSTGNQDDTIVVKIECDEQPSIDESTSNVKIEEKIPAHRGNVEKEQARVVDMERASRRRESDGVWSGAVALTDRVWQPSSERAEQEPDRVEVASHASHIITRLKRTFNAHCDQNGWNVLFIQCQTCSELLGAPCMVQRRSEAIRDHYLSSSHSQQYFKGVDSKVVSCVVAELWGVVDSGCTLCPSCGMYLPDDPYILDTHLATHAHPVSSYPLPPSSPSPIPDTDCAVVKTEPDQNDFVVCVKQEVIEESEKERQLRELRETAQVKIILFMLKKGVQPKKDRWTSKAPRFSKCKSCSATLGRKVSVQNDVDSVRDHWLSPIHCSAILEEVDDKIVSRVVAKLWNAKENLGFVACEFCGVRVPCDSSLIYSHMCTHKGDSQPRRFACPLCTFVHDVRDVVAAHIEDTHPFCAQTPVRNEDDNLNQLEDGLYWACFPGYEDPDAEEDEGDVQEIEIEEELISEEEEEEEEEPACERPKGKRGRKRKDEPDERPFTVCLECGQEVALAARTSHVYMHLPDDAKPFRCPGCRFESKHKYSVELHMHREDHGEIVLVNRDHEALRHLLEQCFGLSPREFPLIACRVCERKERCTPFHLFKHIANYHKDKSSFRRFHCPHCLFENDFAPNVVKHMHASHPDKDKSRPVRNEWEEVWKEESLVAEMCFPHQKVSLFAKQVRVYANGHKKKKNKKNKAAQKNKKN